MKRTRRVKDFKIHLPFIKCPCGRVLHLYLKNPSITFEVIKRVRGDKEGRDVDAKEDQE